MVLIGLLLVAVAAGFAVDLVLENDNNVDVAVLGHTFSTRLGWIAVAGVLALAILVVGVRLVVVGLRRARRRRSVLRVAESTANERDQLAQQLAAKEPVDATP
jgi:hypothetical protein